MNRNRIYFWTGILIILIMIISYSITVVSERGANYIVKTPLLGVLIFHNPFILGIYILIASILIFKGRK